MSKNGCIYSFCLICLLGWTNLCLPFESPGVPQHYKLRESLRVGDTLGVRPENILVKPRWVVSDKTGRVWVADEAILSVKVFDRQGNCLFTIGRRGQGPGEFQSITAMTINNKGELVVVDYLNARIEVFDPQGRAIATYRLPPTVQWPRRICCTPDSGYIFLAKHEKSNPLFHRFTKDFRYVKSFGELPIIDARNAVFEQRFAEAEVGEIVVDSHGILYYAPGLFDGRIYLYENNALIGVYKGATHTKLPYEYEKVERLGRPPAKYQYSMGGPSGMYFARRNVVSGSMNILDDGTLAHLLTILDGQKFETGIEFFTKDGSYRKYQRLAGDKLPDYAWSASSGKWYLIDRLGTPQVIEYIIEPVR